MKAELIVAYGNNKKAVDITGYDLDNPLARALIMDNLSKILTNFKKKENARKVQKAKA
jgi:hypothetical protein